MTGSELENMREVLESRSNFYPTFYIQTGCAAFFGHPLHLLYVYMNAQEQTLYVFLP